MPTASNCELALSTGKFPYERERAQYSDRFLNILGRCRRHDTGWFNGIVLHGEVRANGFVVRRSVWKGDFGAHTKLQDLALDRIVNFAPHTGHEARGIVPHLRSKNLPRSPKMQLQL